MDVHNLVHMANRIGEFFASMPDREEAKEGIAEHLRKFWEPRMRMRLLDHAEQGAAPAPHDIVQEALMQWRGKLVPVAGASNPLSCGPTT